MRYAGPSAILFQNLLHRRFGAQRLQQLDQVGAVANPQQGFTHLVGAVYLFPMNLAKAQHLVGLHLVVQVALLHRDGHVVDKLDARNFRRLAVCIFERCDFGCEHH